MKYSFGYASLLMLLIFLVVVCSLPYMQGIGIDDDGTYATLAFKAVYGKWDIGTSVFSDRILTILPYSVALGAGITFEWLSLIATAILISLIVVVYFLFSLITNKLTALISIIIIGLSPVMLRNGSMVMGDILVALTMNTSVLLCIYFIIERHGKNLNPKSWAILIVVVWFISFLAKEIALIYLPVFGILFLFSHPWKTPKTDSIRTFATTASITGVLMAIGFLGFYFLETGDAFSRFHSIADNRLNATSAYAHASGTDLLIRITVQPIQFLLGDYCFGILFFLSILNLCTVTYSVKDQLIKLYLVASIGLWWFVPTSISPLNFIEFVYRLWIPLLIPMVLNGGMFLYRFTTQRGSLVMSQRSLYYYTIACFLVGVILSFAFSYAQYLRIGADPMGIILPSLVYIGVSMCVAVFTVKSKIATGFGKLIVLSVIIIGPIIAWDSLTLYRWIADGRPNAYLNKKELVSFASNVHAPLVITDPLFHQNYGVYTGFDSSKTSVSYNHVSYTTIPDKSLLLLNKALIERFIKGINATYIFTKSDERVPDFVAHPEKYGFVLIRENKTEKLYQLNKKLLN